MFTRASRAEIKSPHHGSNLRAQYGEDKILKDELLGHPAGYFVDVGAYDGESYSNTYFLEKSFGWTGVLIEADPKLHEEGKKVRPGSISVNLAAVGPGVPETVSFDVVDGCRWVSSLSISDAMLKRIEDVPKQIRKVTVPARTLDAILEQVKAPAPIGLISIDVEGHEWAVLQGLTLDRWRPRIIILERNNHFPDARIMQRLHAHGYGWRRTTGCNDWFYADAARSPSYKPKIAVAYYLPKYLTVFQPAMVDPAKRTAKRALRRIGLLEKARRLFRKHKSGRTGA